MKSTEFRMTSQYVWIGIIVGVFFAGLGIGYVVFTTITPNYIMQNPQLSNQMMSNPQFRSMWTNYMTFNPQAMNDWTNTMMNNPNFMNMLMTAMMKNPQFQQQYMGPWITVQSPYFMQHMMNQLSIPQNQSAKYAYPIVKTDQVSIVSGAWQINTTQSYSPTIIQTSTGTTVTWTNNDNVVHTVTDVGGTFDSHLILPNNTWKYTFNNAGKYNYFCTLHPWMKGIVIVS
jgi:plastocyanin